MTLVFSTVHVFKKGNNLLFALAIQRVCFMSEIIDFESKYLKRLAIETNIRTFEQKIRQNSS